MTYFIPESLQIGSLLYHFSTEGIKPFKKHHLLYILDLITSIPANNKGFILQNGFVPINAKTLQKKVRNYNQYLKYLVSSNVLYVNKHYIPGEKSRGYKFTEAYGTPVRIVSDNKTNDVSIRIGKPRTKLSVSQRKQYGHLIKWYNTYFQINCEMVLPYIYEDYKRKITNPALKDCDEFSGQCKDPVEQYNSAFLNTEKFSRGAFLLNIDAFGNRLHSPLTNIRSELRNLLTYNKLQLVSIDINNSQPYLSTLLFNPSFWAFTDIADVLTHNSIGISLKEIFNSSVIDSFIMICKESRSRVDSDVHTYTEIVKSGRFYEYMAKQMKTGISDRSKLKAAIFQVLFTDNRYIGQEQAAPKRKFRDIFPDVYNLFSLIKRKQKINMPKLLQRIESHIVLSVITQRIAIEKPDLPIFTIHDSIVTIKGFEHYIEKVMEEEMTKILGFPPKLTLSLWKPENLKFKDGTPFHLVQSAA
jgi:hypothetical protein